MASSLEALFERILRSDYYRYEPVIIKAKGTPYQVVAKMGLPGWPDDDYAAELLATQARLTAEARVAVLGCGNGLVPLAAAGLAHAGQILALDADYLAVEATRRTLALNQVQNVQVRLGDGTQAIQGQTFDALLVNLPKGRELIEQIVVDAYQLLDVGGQIYVAGANRAGIKAVGPLMDKVFGNVRVLAYRKGHRIFQATRTAQAPGPPPDLAPRYYVEQRLNLQARGTAYEVLTKPGIFGWDKLDQGTEMLLEAMRIGAGDTVLDLGCGYGIVGLVAASLAPQGYVHAVDANSTAATMATRTFEHNRISNAAVHVDDAIAAVREIQFDTVVTNPPFHAGVEAEFATALAFIAGSAAILKPGGHLYLVANRFIKYEPILERLFARVRPVHQDNRFKVLEGTR